VTPRNPAEALGTGSGSEEAEDLVRESGSEFLGWRAGADDWLGAPCCSFWWD
jgi:hypothetical protein